MIRVLLTLTNIMEGRNKFSELLCQLATHLLPLVLPSTGRHLLVLPLRPKTGISWRAKREIHSICKRLSAVICSDFSECMLNPSRHTFTICGTICLSKHGRKNYTHIVCPCSQLFMQLINHRSFRTAALSTPRLLNLVAALHYIVLLLVV